MQTAIKARRIAFSYGGKWLCCLVFTLLGLPPVAAEMTVYPVGADKEDARKVVMFSSTFCHSCYVMKDYLQSKGVPFMEFDIERSSAARDYFTRLGGRGTPFLLVNNKRMHGIDASTFWSLYESNE